MTAPLHEPLTRTPEPPAAVPGGATALLDAYRPGDRFLATPGRTLLGSGTAAEIPHAPAVPLGERVRRVLDARRAAGDPAPVVIGCLPFLPDAPPALAVPARLRRG
ncbi:isochorismate synthase, partial [Streptomyces sp. SID11385]|nr:isochorismate synthase [Streptomyces sp. SID11385]